MHAWVTTLVTSESGKKKKVKKTFGGPRSRALAKREIQEKKQK